MESLAWLIFRPTDARQEFTNFKKKLFLENKVHATKNLLSQFKFLPVADENRLPFQICIFSTVFFHPQTLAVF
jgi:hypothetical protein